MGAMVYRRGLLHLSRGSEAQRRSAKGAAAWEKVRRADAIAKLQPPLDSYELEALGNRIHTPDIDAEALHHVFVTFPKKLDCDIAQNPNALSDDLAAIWKARDCPDYYLTINPDVPLEIVQSIFDSTKREDLDEWGRMARDGAALRLATDRCDPEFLYSLYDATGEFAPETKTGGLIRIRMATNLCTPEVVWRQMQRPPELKQAAEYAKSYRRTASADSRVREAQEWRPKR